MYVLCLHRGQKWVLSPRTEVTDVVSLRVVLETIPGPGEEQPALNC